MKMMDSNFKALKRNKIPKTTLKTKIYIKIKIKISRRKSKQRKIKS